MFFVSQKSNQCGLHAIQNMLKSAAITTGDMHSACETIHENTGDPLQNHESIGGNWSVAAVLQALQSKGLTVTRAVSTKNERAWTGKSMEDLLQDETFRGFLVHQPTRHHFACMRPEKVGDEQQLYYVDSQSDGPIRISTRLALRRCLSPAYAWEPYVVCGDELPYVAPDPSPLAVYDNIQESNVDRPKPPESFLREWRAFTNP
tara:strand:+ start:97 stop:708 length:612 start_codon:yes stop_codon:yes gene_type:complete